MVLPRSRRTDHLVLEIRGQRETNTSRRHPLDPLPDRLTGHAVPRTDLPQHRRRCLPQSSPIQHRLGPPLERPENTPDELRDNLQERLPGNGAASRVTATPSPAAVSGARLLRMRRVCMTIAGPNERDQPLGSGDEVVNQMPPSGSTDRQVQYARPAGPSPMWTT